MAIFLTFIFVILFIFLFPSFKKKVKYLIADYNRDYNYLLENERKRFATIVLAEDVLEVLSKVFNRKLRVNDKFIMPYYSIFSMSKKSQEDLKEMKAEYVDIALTSYLYRDGQTIISMIAYEHYGRPRWDGEKMYYNYPIKEYYFASDIKNFEQEWLKVKEQILKV